MSVQIKYGNVTCKIIGALPDNVNNKITMKLSYMTGGFGIPKQRNYLYNNLTQCTYTGLIPYVISILKAANIQYELIDARQKPVSAENYNLSEGITPYDYQQDVLDNASSRTIVQICTGGGKTLVMAGMITKFDVKPVIVFSPKATLAYQLQGEISKFLGVKVGILTGNDKDIQDITVCTPQTALKSDLIGQAKAILFDECQFLGAHTLFCCARAAKNAYYRCAVSATPWRDGDDDLLIEAAINVRNPKSNVSASMLINKGKLTPVRIRFIRQAQTTGWLGNYNATYNKEIANNTARNNKIIRLIQDCEKKDCGSILVLVNKIAHGNLLLNRIRKEVKDTKFNYDFEGKTYELHSCEFLSGQDEMGKRNAILKAAKEEKVTILIGTTVADEGLSVNPLKVLILAGAGKSSTKAFQRVGRVLRLDKKHTQAYVFDFWDENPTFNYHSRVRQALYSTEPEWAKNMKIVNY